MFLNSLKIIGYKSFYHKINLKNFTPGINLLLGPNGSGKSNFLDAIKFVFNDFSASSNFDVSEKTKKKYKNNNFFFSIQLTFNNTDRIFPIYNDIIVFQRTTGENFDRLWINGKYFSPRQFFSFLDSIGFNPQTFLFSSNHTDQFLFKYLDSFKRFEYLRKILGLEVFMKVKKKIVKSIKNIFNIKTNTKVLIKKMLDKINLTYNFYSTKKIDSKIKNSYFLLANLILSIKTKKFSKINNKIFEIKKIEIFYFYKKLNENLFFSSFINHIEIWCYNLKYHLKKITQKKNIRNLVKCKNNKNKLLQRIEFLFSCHLLNKHNDYWKNVFTRRVYTAINGFKSTYLSSRSKFDSSTGISLNKDKYFFTKNDFYKKILDSGKFLNKNAIIFKKDPRYFFEIQKLIFAKKKLFEFYKKEIDMETKYIELIINTSENTLKNHLGKKIVYGIYTILKIIKNDKKIKSKIYGLFFDLISVNSSFIHPVESFFSGLLSNIILRDRKTAKSILKKLENFDKINGSFITMDSVLNKRSQKKFLKDVFPISLTIYSKLKFKNLIETICSNVYISGDLCNLKNFSRIENVKIVSMNGDIFYPDGFCSLSNSYQKKGIFRLISNLKKNRNFYNFTEKLKNIHYDFKKKLKMLYTKFSKLFLILQKISIFSDIGLVRNYIFDDSKIKNKAVKRIEKKINFIYSIQEIKNLKINQKNLRISDKNLKEQTYHIILSLCKYLITLNQVTPRSQKIASHLSGKIFYDFRKKNLVYDRFYRKKKKFFDKKNFNIMINILKMILQKSCTLFNGLLVKNFLGVKYFSLNKELKYFNSIKISNIFFYEQKKNKKIYILLLDRLRKKKNKTQEKKKQAESRRALSHIEKLFSCLGKIDNDIILLKQSLLLFIIKYKKYLHKNLDLFSKEFFFIFKNIFNLNGRILFFYYIKTKKNNVDKKKTFKKIGMNIIVDFEKKNQNVFLEQMSNGQITISSCAIFMSFRKFSTISSYIFDEIDVNLDNHFIKKFSYIIKKISSFGQQVIIVSFSSKTVLGADKWIGTWFSNKGTMIKFIDKNKAIGFLNP